MPKEEPGFHNVAYTGETLTNDALVDIGVEPDLDRSKAVAARDGCEGTETGLVELDPVEELVGEPFVVQKERQKLAPKIRESAAYNYQKLKLPNAGGLVVRVVREDPVPEHAVDGALRHRVQQLLSYKAAQEVAP